MIEPTITCPKCKTEIRLTESLAAPLIEVTRQQFEETLSQKDEEIAQRDGKIPEAHDRAFHRRRSFPERKLQPGCGNKHLGHRDDDVGNELPEHAELVPRL